MIVDERMVTYIRSLERPASAWALRRLSWAARS